MPSSVRGLPGVGHGQMQGRIAVAWSPLRASLAIMDMSAYLFTSNAPPAGSRSAQ